jgi:hypothetical protein
MSFDLTITPIYRINRRDQASLPGLMAATPPRKAARGRDADRLIVYLLLTGNATFTTGEYIQFASRAVLAFYETQGAITSALRTAAEAINKPLLERNMSTSGRGQYAVGLLTLAAVRDSQVTFLLSGPARVFTLTASGAKQISDVSSGKGLGLNAALPYYFSQLTLQSNDRLLFAGKIPSAWETTLNDASPASLDATRRRLLTLTSEDVNAVLIQATDGNGTLTVLRPATEAPQPSDVKAAPVQTAEPTPVTTAPKPAEEPVVSEAAAHMLQPSAYAIPPQPKDETPLPEESPAPQDLLASLPRAKPLEPPLIEEEPEPLAQVVKKSSELRQPSERTRRAAKVVVNGMQVWRQGMTRFNDGMQKFLPRLLPNSDESVPAEMPSSAMIFIALLIPLIVVTVLSVVYFRYGRSVQYEEYLVQAQNEHTQALTLADPASQREAWQRELFYLDKADEYSKTDQTMQLRQEAQGNLDKLQGISRLQFQPVLNGGVGTQISRIAASENDVYLLDAQRGGILHLVLTSGGFQQDNSFNCQPGSYGDGKYNVGPLVDILAMPINTPNGSVIGVDAAGNLLYCATNQVAQAIPLPPPDTNWGRVTAFTLDSGNLYVMDAPSRAVWVYVGKDGSFVDRPYFFFGGQIPALQDAIDLAVSGDELYILHSDGHLSHCSYSRIEAKPTRCEDPVAMTNPLPAYKDVNVFTQAHFTQMMFTPAPDSALLLLDSDGQGIFRLTSRSPLELQSQLRPSIGSDNPIPSGPIGAMTVSPNHIIYMAFQDKIYFAVNSP